jgi:glycerophosphoryl diester phosphodiesterase
MAPTQSVSGPSVVPALGLSFRQAQVAMRGQWYLERALRSRNVTHEGWDKEVGWTDADAQPYLDAHQSASICDVLRYRKPVATPPEHLDRYRIDPPMKDLSVLRGVARVELVTRRPELQQAVFGWTTPPGRNARSWEAFEAARYAYWENCTHENRMEMHTLQDTADFHANDLLRALYLYGEMPPQLRTADAVWRAPDTFARNDNFSSRIESEIVDRLLSFKYWIDEPFAVTDPARPGDHDRITAERARLAAIKKHVGGPAQPHDAREYPPDDDSKVAEMTFWSENHQLLFATAEYLAGQWLPDAVFRAGNPYRSEGPNRTRPGDLTGRQHMTKARKRLIRWLNDRLRFGFSEWNAPGYYEEDLSPLFNLANFCLDEQVRTRAHMVIDLVIFDLARFTMRGSFGVTAGRDYFEQKNCGYGQSVGDLIEVLFGSRDGVIVGGDSGCALGLLTSRRYVVPDALIEVGCDPHRRVVDRSRISLTFDEAPLHGIGFKSDEDVMFWWSRAAYFVKQLIGNSHALAAKSHLLQTAPFKDILPKIDSAADALSTVDTLKRFAIAVAFPGVGAVVAGLMGGPSQSDQESSIADVASVLTEGSALTRANLYTYRDRHAMLSSAQNFRAGQFNFQTQVVMATLSLEAVVWTGHPSAGAYIPRETVQEAGEVGGGFLGGALGGLALGPVGLVVGGIIGAHAGAKAGKSAAGADPKGIKIYPDDTHDGPNWWTGTVSSPRVVQRDNAAIAIYKAQGFELFFGKRTHAWFPIAGFDQGSVFQRAGHSNVKGLWTFGRVGDGYVGLYSAVHPAWTTDGPWKDKELRCEQSGNVFIYQVGSREQFGTYDAFVDAVSRSRIHVDDLESCRYDVPHGGTLALDYADGGRAGGRAFSDDRFPRFQNPYVSAGYVGWNQYHYTIAHNGATLTHDFRELKTVEREARVTRDVQGKIRHENDHFLAIAHHGSPKTSVENTIQSCHQAVQVEHANAVEIDLCLTRDNHLVLWHDWSPDDPVALIRQVGEQGNNRFRPSIPDVLSSWRRPVNELTLDELREHYGYEEIDDRDYVGKINPVDRRIPTLVEFLEAATGWDNLEHMFLDVKMPDSAAVHAARMMDLVDAALRTPHAFAVTAMVPHEKVLQGMKTRASQTRSKVAFSWDREFPPGLVLHASEYSAVEGAIQYSNTIASVGRPTSLTFRPWHVYQTIVEYDIHRWDQFNLDPRTNKGRQIDKLIAWTIDDRNELDWLLMQGVSGVITDDIPMLRDAAQFHRLPL